MTSWIAGLFLCHPSLGFSTKLGDGLHFAAALARLSATPAVVAKIRERAKSVRSRKQPKWLGPQTKMQCHATRLSQTSRRATFKPRCPPQRTLVHGIPLLIPLSYGGRAAFQHSTKCLRHTDKSLVPYMFLRAEARFQTFEFLRKGPQPNPNAVSAHFTYDPPLSLQRRKKNESNSRRTTAK